MTGSWWRSVRLDPFLMAILGAAVLATLLPARGAAVGALDLLSTLMIGLLFFLYGARLHPKEALRGLTHWRLHLVILAFTYLLFPLVGVALTFLPRQLIGPELAVGVLYLTLVPSTVQSSINFTSIARGNVAGALVSATASNLLGVVLTPLLVVLLMDRSGSVAVGGRAMLDILVQILLPFVLGQVSRRWTAAAVVTHKKGLKLVDQGVIVLVVYTAFSAGVREGIWQLVTWQQLAVLVVLLAALVAIFLVLTWRSARALGFDVADSIAIQMCGTKKSLASGLPMATVLFASSAVPVGLVVLPLMVFHQLQLMACGVLATQHARRADAAVAPG